MLDSFSTHGLFDLTVQCDGDLDIDDHHTVEDVAITLGEAFTEALDDKRGIRRFADRKVPLDEAVASVVVDISGRPYFEFDGEFSQASVGGMTSHMAKHFCRSLSMNAGLTLHCDVDGENAHHEIEALFKSLARSLEDATRIDERRSDVASTKGELSPTPRATAPVSTAGGVYPPKSDVRRDYAKVRGKPQPTGGYPPSPRTRVLGQRRRSRRLRRYRDSEHGYRPRNRRRPPGGRRNDGRDSRR